MFRKLNLYTTDELGHELSDVWKYSPHCKENKSMTWCYVGKYRCRNFSSISSRFTNNNNNSIVLPAKSLLKMMAKPSRERKAVYMNYLLPNPVRKAGTVPRLGVRASERLPSQTATPCRPHFWPRRQWAQHPTPPRSTMFATRSSVSQPNCRAIPYPPEAPPFWRNKRFRIQRGLVAAKQAVPVPATVASAAAEAAADPVAAA